LPSEQTDCTLFIISDDRIRNLKPSSSIVANIMAPKTVLITGSSSGFGLSLVQLFLRQGHNVLATSRSPQKTPDLVKGVENHPGKRGRWMQLDVTWPQSKINSTISEASKVFGPIDVLINNAGYCHQGGVEDIDEEKSRAQFDTNYWGVMRMCKAVLPSMRERKQGTIVNISSIAGLNALPTMGVYAGSKWALEGESCGGIVRVEC
jgi:NAD(P)-dependent dehydrogenase (short-subunit alcohol dehydrogenase family)